MGTATHIIVTIFKLVNKVIELSNTTSMEFILTNNCLVVLDENVEDV